jgi:hypothetical protein
MNPLPRAQRVGEQLGEGKPCERQALVDES